MSAIKGIIKLAEKKGIDLQYLAVMTGYKHKYHLKRGLANPGGITCKRIIKMANTLKESPADILNILSKYQHTDKNK